jgi:hypothetical protein
MVPPPLASLPNNGTNTFAAAAAAAVYEDIWAHGRKEGRQAGKETLRGWESVMRMRKRIEKLTTIFLFADGNCSLTPFLWSING